MEVDILKLTKSWNWRSNGVDILKLKKWALWIWHSSGVDIVKLAKQGSSHYKLDEAWELTL